MHTNSFNKFLTVTGKSRLWEGLFSKYFVHVNVILHFKKEMYIPFQTDFKGRFSSWLTFLLTGRLAEGVLTKLLVTWKVIQIHLLRRESVTPRHSNSEKQAYWYVCKDNAVDYLLKALCLPRVSSFALYTRCERVSCLLPLFVCCCFCCCWFFGFLVFVGFFFFFFGGGGGGVYSGFNSLNYIQTDSEQNGR